MKKTIWFLIVFVLAVLVLGIYKFDYLSGQPGYDVDGNALPTVPAATRTSP